jgi:hypothetical protein
MATETEFTFASELLEVDVAEVETDGYVRDRFNQLLPYRPGDFVVKLADGSLTVLTAAAAVFNV